MVVEHILKFYAVWSDGTWSHETEKAYESDGCGFARAVINAYGSLRTRLTGGKRQLLGLCLHQE